MKLLRCFSLRSTALMDNMFMHFKRLAIQTQHNDTIFYGNAPTSEWIHSQIWVNDYSE